MTVFQVKNMRKEIADLLRTSKQENARIRVETVIRENLLLQAFETLELFMELLAVRAQLVEKSKDMPPDMIEALSSLVYSAQRLQVYSTMYIAASAPCCHQHVPTDAAVIGFVLRLVMFSIRRPPCPSYAVWLKRSYLVSRTSQSSSSSEHSWQASTARSTLLKQAQT